MYAFNHIVAQNPKEPIEIALKGSREELTQIMEILHVMRFVEIGEWCPIVPNKLEGQYITLINRHKNR